MDRKKKNKLRKFFLEIAGEDPDSVKEVFDSFQNDLESFDKIITALAKTFIKHGEKLESLEQKQKGDIGNVERALKLSQKTLSESLEHDLKALSSDFGIKLSDWKKEYATSDKKTSDEWTKFKKTTNKLLDELANRVDLIPRESGISPFGGSNRTFYIAGVPASPNNLYADINLIAGTNVTITAVNNNTTKRADVTITASGGGGGGLSKETPVGTIDNANVTFTVNNVPFFINVNGAIYNVGDGQYASLTPGTPNTITLTNPVGTGGFIKSYY